MFVFTSPFPLIWKGKGAKLTALHNISKMWRHLLHIFLLKIIGKVKADMGLVLQSTK